MFGKFGSITEAAVIRNKFDGRSRGFGFVTFEGEVADLAVKEMHGQVCSSF